VKRGGAPDLLTRSLRGDTSYYGTYFWNSTLVVVSAVAILTVLGAIAAHCFARYRFRGNRFPYFLIFTVIIFPPQVTIISLFQVLVKYGLFRRCRSASRSSWGDQMQDIGMIATGLMIAIVPVILVYALFSEKLIRGMTAVAVKS
jgi:ABC-type glycerol-3-phosphate transport system permease component